VAEVEPATETVSLFTIVNTGQGTDWQLRTFAQFEIPAPSSIHAITNVFPALEEYPKTHVTECVAQVNPVIDVVSLFEMVIEGQLTASQVNTFDQAEIPGFTPTQVETKEFPLVEV